MRLSARLLFLLGRIRDGFWDYLLRDRHKLGAARTRLSLESLELRDTPAVVPNNFIISYGDSTPYTGSNPNPVPLGATISGAYNQPLGLLSNVSGGNNLTRVTGITQPSDGSVAWNGYGTFTDTVGKGSINSDGTINPGYEGWDSFDYSVTNGTTSGTVSYLIGEAAPTVTTTELVYDTAKNRSLSVSGSSGIMARAGAAAAAPSDPIYLLMQMDSNPLHDMTSTSTAPLLTADGGKVWLGDGNFTYSTPSTTFTGWDYFTVQVWNYGDATGFSTPVTVWIDVGGGGGNPTLGNATLSTVAGAPLSASLTTYENSNGGPPLSTTAQTTAATAAGGNVTIDSDGTFSYNPPPNYVGSDSFTYQATNAAGWSGNATVTINVNQAPTVTTLISSTNTSVYGQSISFTASVARSDSYSGTPSGNVEFLDGDVLLGTEALNDGTATFMSSYLGAGTYSVTVEYVGGGVFASSTSATPATLIITPRPLTFTLSDADKTYDGTTVATPMLTPVGLVNDDSVTFTYTSAAFADANVGTGKMVTVSSISIGGAAAGNYAASATATGTANITPADTITVLQGPNLNPSAFDDSLTFTANVFNATSPTGTPQGSVRFLYGYNLLGIEPLVNGTATFTTAAIAVGTWPIMAVFDPATNPDGSSNTLTSNETVTQTVLPAPTITAPGPQSIDVNELLAFASSAGTAISITGPAGSYSSPSLQVALAVNYGTLTLAATSGINITAGGQGQASITLTGTPDAINAALNGLTYTPNTDYNGGDTLSITATDLGVASGSTYGTTATTVPITIGYPVEAVDDEAETPPGEAVTIDVLANDSGADSIESVSSPANGTAEIEDNQIVYTPTSGFIGVDAFTYTIVGDSGTAYSTAAVVVTVAVPAPTITGICPDTGVSNTDGLTDDDTTLTINGTSTPDAAITLYADDEEIGTTTADDEGNWSFTWNYTDSEGEAGPIPEGTYDLTATATDEEDNVSDPSDVYQATIDVTPPVVTLTAPDSSSLAPTVYVTAQDLNGVPDGDPVTIQISADGLGDDWADCATGTLENGAAEIQVPELPGAGDYLIRAGTYDNAGNFGCSDPVTLTIEGSEWALSDATRQYDPLASNIDEQTLDLDDSPGTDASNGAALVYNSSTVNVTPVLQATLQTDNSQDLPAEMTVTLTWDGVEQTPVTYDLSSYSPGDAIQLAVSPNGPVTTGEHEYTIDVCFPDDSGVEDLEISGTTFTISQDLSVFGAGWSFAGVDRLYTISGTGDAPAGALMTYGDGTWEFFQSNGDGGYISPSGDFGTLTGSAEMGWTYATPDGQVTTFDGNGMQTNWTNAVTGESTSATYVDADDAGYADDIATYTAIDGTTSTFNYVGSSVSSISTLSRTVYLNQVDGDLVQFVNADNSARNFTYDDNNYLLSDQLGNQATSWTYSNGLLTSQTVGTGAEAATTEIQSATQAGFNAPQAGPSWGVTTDPLGRTTYTLYDAKGNELEEIDPDGGVQTWVRDSNGLVTSYTDALGNTTTYTYDTLGYLTEQINPDGSTETFTYIDMVTPNGMALHLLSSSTDEDGTMTSYTYNIWGQMTGETITAAGGGANTAYAFSYNSLGLLAEVDQVLVNGSLVRQEAFAYDSTRRETSAEDADGNFQYISYDLNGNVSETIDDDDVATYYSNDALGNLLTETTGTQTQQFMYDPAGDLAKMIDARGILTLLAYNSRGDNTSETVGANTSTPVTMLTSFDLGDDPTSTTDGDGRVATTQFDSMDNPIGDTDPLGNKDKEIYDLDGNLIAQQDANGKWTSYTYNSLGEMTSQTDALGITTSYTYDNDGNLLSETDPNGTTSYTYDYLGRQTSETDPDGNTTYTTYDQFGNVASTTDADGNTTTYTYDADGNMLTETDPLGKVTTWTYDGDGNVLSETDPLGKTTTYTYDIYGNQLTETDPDGNTTSWTYDADGNVLSMTDPNGKTTTYSYDGQNELVSTTDPLGHTTTDIYDPAGNLLATTDAEGKTTTYTYDADGNMLTETDPLGKTTRWTYNGDGNVLSETDPNGQTTSWTYDGDGNTLTETDPLDNVTSWTYDAEGNELTETDPQGSVTSWTYDADGNNTSETDPDGNTTRWTYDKDGNVTSETDPDGNVTSYVYDADGNQIQVTSPTGAISTFTYNADGQVTSETDALGRTITYGYDNAGNLLQQTWIAADGVTITNRANYTYDADGNMLSASDFNSSYTYTYDADGQMLTQSGMGFTFTFGYDADGNVTSITDQTGASVTSSYNGDGQLTARQLAGPGLTTIGVALSYDSDGNLILVSRTANGAAAGTTANYYDGDGNITEITDKDASGNVLAAYSYTYNSVGELASETENGVTTYYSYDAAGELTAAGSSGYSYDPNGVPTDSGDTTGADNELTSDGTWNYNYDVIGNLISKTSVAAGGVNWYYTYNGQNLMTQAQEKDSNGNILTTVNYTYDVFGNLIGRTEIDADGTTTTAGYVYAGSTSWADVDGSGAIAMRYLYLDGEDQVVAREDASGNIGWYLTDYQGSVREIVDSSGNVLDAITYDAYGNITSETDPTAGDRIKYTGRWWDATVGLQNNRARWYDPATGDFTTQDPLGFGGGQSNLSEYAGDGPTDGADPSGMDDKPIEVEWVPSRPLEKKSPKSEVKPEKIINPMKEEEVIWTNVKQPEGTSIYTLISIKPATINKIQPQGINISQAPTDVSVVIPPNINLTNEDLKKIQSSVFASMKKEYDAIMKKQDDFKNQIPGSLPPSSADLLSLLEAAALGIKDAGINGVQGKVEGGLSQSILQYGLKIGTEDVKVGAKFGVSVDKDWKTISLGVGPEFTLNKGNFVFAPSFFITPEGKASGGNINILLRW